MAQQWPPSQLDELLAQSLAMEDYSASITSSFPLITSTNNGSHQTVGSLSDSDSNSNSNSNRNSNSNSKSSTNPLPPPKVPNPPSLPLVLRRYVAQKSVIDLSDDLTAVNPDVFVLFQKYNILFFDSKLSGCELKWSKRMTLCAGLCCYEGRGGLCSIKLSSPLLQYRSTQETVETLIHEMIHAFLFVTVRDRDRDGHGPSFQSLMNVVNYVSGLNISIYHSFHDEVDEHRKHIWKCDGQCQHRPPYFGVVKRAMNRPPGPNDSWYSRHQQQCGGRWTKISEPPEFTEKQRKKREREERKKQRERQRAQSANTKGNGKGKAKSNGKRKGTKSKVKGNGNGRTLLDMFEGDTKAADTEGTPRKKRLKVTTENTADNEHDDDDDDIEILDTSSTYNGAGNGKKRKIVRVICPICSQMVEQSKINVHLDSCLS